MRALTQWAESHGHTMTELAIAWLLAQPHVSSVIAGVTSETQVNDNVKAAEWELSGDELGEVNRILEGHAG